MRSGLQAGTLGSTGAGAGAALHMHPLRCLLCLVMLPACISLLQGQFKYVQTAFHGRFELHLTKYGSDPGGTAAHSSCLPCDRRTA